MESRPLPLKSLVEEAIRLVWHKRIRLLRALTSSAVLFAAISVAADLVLSDRSSWQLGLGLVAASAIPFTLFAVTCHRIMLLGDDAAPTYGISWSRRELRFLGWSAVGSFYFMLALIGIGLAITLGSKSPSRSEDFSPIWWIAFLLAWYLPARLSVLLPATAIDERHDMAWAWYLTSGNGWRLVIVIGLLPCLWNVLLDVIPTKHAPIAQFIVLLLSYPAVAIQITALSLTFRFLDQCNAANDQ